MTKEHTSDKSINNIVKSMGLVFGDIGTSPIYTLTVIFLITKHSVENIIGVLSLIVWTLVVLVTIEYSWLAMKLGKKGEGGTIVLKELLRPMLKSSRQVAFISLLSIVGISLLMGDGVITPAISILSAVEGILLIPGFENTSNRYLILIASIIAIVLFIFQKKGTEKVARAFGPLMIVWFLALTLSGLAAMASFPAIVKSVNPVYGIKFLMNNGIQGFFILSEVTLCATGGEALYADMGHLGRIPIIRAWYVVFIALLINYLGQGAFLATHPGAKNILFEMVLNHARVLYVPFLLLSIMATVIASQAMISGMFSIVYQSITTRVMPMFKVSYTSEEMRSQIYIGFVNWFLLASVLFIMYVFKESANLAAAYGLAVTGTMTLTGFFMTWIYHLRKQHFPMIVSAFVGVADLVFFLSNTFKIPHGGYWSIIIALIPFSIIMIYTSGQKRLYKRLKPMSLEHFLPQLEIRKTDSKISGTALFFARDANWIPPYIVSTMFWDGIIYEDNIIVSMEKIDDPFGVQSCLGETLAEGLRTFTIKMGYMEVVDVEKILHYNGIYEKTIFYGIEDIATDNLLWKIFSMIKRLTPSFVQFYALPSHKLRGVINRIDM